MRSHPSKTTMLLKINIRQILLAGLALRLLAVVFSPGYAFYDDHFAVVELANEWFKGNIGTVTGEGVYVFSLLYPGIHYLLIAFCNFLGITDPEGIMIVIRLIHALVSVAGIYFAWLLASKLSDQKEVPLLAALLMAAFWLFPFLSVRSLREFFCIPFLLAGACFAIDDKKGLRSIFLSALFFVLAVCIRIQCIIFPFVFGLFWLFNKSTFTKAMIFGLGFIVVFFLTQGLFDGLFYGNPLASTLEYFRYNADPRNISEYPTGPWYQYLGTLTGMVLLIPVFLLTAGYLYSFRLSVNHKMIFISSLLFFVFHSYYANKQERFILPFLPFFLLLGIIGLTILYKEYRNNKWFVRFTRFSSGWFLIMNTLLLGLLTFSYTKRSRVEAMNYLRQKKDVRGIIMEGPVNTPPPPLFYLGKRTDVELINTLSDSGFSVRPDNSANYIIIVGNAELDKRTSAMKKHFPGLKEEKIISPGFLDNIAHRLNPRHNRNESWYIYRIEDP